MGVSWFGKSPLPDYGDGVLVCGTPRAADTPSMSPFVLKLETFLRMVDIDYTFGNFQGFSSKNKVPWIIVDGKTVEDSEFCIEALIKKFDSDPDEKLSDVQKASARALTKMAEENLYWCLVMFRYHFTSGYPDDMCVRFFKTSNPWLIQRLFLYKISRNVYSMAWYQGIGRHSEEEVKQIMEGDLRALSDFLGNKAFFMGDEATRVDCAIFGVLGAMVRWGVPENNPAHKYLKENCRNLWEYCDRMKNRFWPDWNTTCSSTSTDGSK